jgi:DNA-binding CsgD family transcriptional regulator
MLQVLGLLGQGRTRMLAAAALGISKATLDSYVCNAYGALGASSLVEALSRLRERDAGFRLEALSVTGRQVSVREVMVDGDDLVVRLVIGSGG